MLERIAMQPGRVCSAPECAGAERKLRACRDDMLVELALMHDAEIAVLNAAHLGCAGPTNILSFPASPEEAGLGVLALGVETWLREATLYGGNGGACAASAGAWTGPSFGARSWSGNG